jgi:uncharacterized membrane protein
MPTTLVLALHILAGATALLFGAVALIFRKGSPRHRTAGNVFFASMLTVSAVGAYLGFIKSQQGNMLIGILSLYLVTAAWLTGRRKAGSLASPTGSLFWSH